MEPLDYDSAIKVLDNIFWVGFEEKETSLHCNPYILIDEGSTGDEVVLFDPGSIPDFPQIMRKVIEVVSPQSITAVVVSHQDPDVCGNLPIVEDIVGNPDLKVVSHTNTGRLIYHYGLKSHMYHVDKNDYKLTLKSGRVLEFIYAPYLHSPGAIVTYDRKTKTLFSGDIFGGVSKEWGLFADENFLEPMKVFHELYMPSNQILRNFMEKIESYEIDRVIPQHGSILEGNDVQKAIEFLKELPCGVDLIK